MNLAADDDTSLGDDGWLVGANVFDSNFNFLYDNISLVPEPSTFALVGGIAALGLVFYRRRRK